MRSCKRDIKRIVEKKAIHTNVSKFYLLIKRIFDIIAAAAILVILMPALTLIAIAIKIDSRGDIFYTQKRCGLMGKVFKSYRFRTSKINMQQSIEELNTSDETGCLIFLAQETPTVTRIGKIMRKTGIDNLPQLFNVLKGDLSLVGPQAPLVKEIGDYDIWHNLRFSVKPGLTGLWWISGKDCSSFEDMVRLDLKYIRERSFLYDLKILAKSIQCLFFSKNVS